MSEQDTRQAVKRRWEQRETYETAEVDPQQWCKSDNGVDDDGGSVKSTMGPAEPINVEELSNILDSLKDVLGPMLQNGNVVATEESGSGDPGEDSDNDESDHDEFISHESDVDDEVIQSDIDAESEDGDEESDSDLDSEPEPEPEVSDPEEGEPEPPCKRRRKMEKKDDPFSSYRTKIEETLSDKANRERLRGAWLSDFGLVAAQEGSKSAHVLAGMCKDRGIAIAGFTDENKVRGKYKPLPDGTIRDQTNAIVVYCGKPIKRKGTVLLESPFTYLT